MKKAMKKVLLSAICIILTGSLSGCSYIKDAEDLVKNVNQLLPFLQGILILIVVLLAVIIILQIRILRRLPAKKDDKKPDAKNDDNGSHIANCIALFAVGIILPLFAVSPVAVADDSEYPLIHATYYGDIAEVKRLLDGGANPNVINKNNNTALMLLQANDDDEEIVKLLLSAGANPNAVNNNGNTALARTYNTEIVKMLLAAGANPNLSRTPALIRAMDNQDSLSERVKMLLAAGADVHAVNGHGETALISAAPHGGAEVVKILISAGANTNAADNNGKTALMKAKWYRSAETIAVLQNFRPSVSPEEYIAGLQAEYCGDIATIECQENVAEVNGEVDKSASAEEYAFRQFSEMSADEQAEFCISIRSPQRPCFCTTGIVCTENYCIDRPNCIEPEDADYKHLLNNYIPPEESVAEESANESAADESVVEEPAEPETKTVCRSFANGINPDNTQWGRIGASEAGVGETEYAAIRAAIRICENDGLTECQTNLEVKCEEVAVQ